LIAGVGEELLDGAGCGGETGHCGDP
jgi:hypothetical protein